MERTNCPGWCNITSLTIVSVDNGIGIGRSLREFCEGSISLVEIMMPACANLYRASNSVLRYVKETKGTGFYNVIPQIIVPVNDANGMWRSLKTFGEGSTASSTFRACIMSRRSRKLIDNVTMWIQDSSSATLLFTPKTCHISFGNWLICLTCRVLRSKYCSKLDLIANVIGLWSV